MKKTYFRLLPALLAAALCVMALWAVPLGPVPVTLATLGVYLAAGLLPWRQAAAGVGLYVLLGAVGLPVFSGFTGGLHRLTGVTGGFLLGYILCAALASRLMAGKRPFMVPVGLLAGTAVLYTVGTLWYLAQSGGTLWGAVLVCVVPFLPGDAAKLLVATAVVWPLRRRLERLHRHK